jgi:ribosomal protein S18 acetylase RimI-like enzyme
MGNLKTGARGVRATQKADRPSVRRAVAGDVSDVLKVFQGARAEMAYLPRLHSVDQDAEFLSTLIGSVHVEVAEHDGHVVGFFVVTDGWLEQLYISPDHQRRGFGRRLLEGAKAASPAGFTLWVFEENVGAIAFYEREGFRLKEKRNAEEADNEEGLADRLYEWTADLHSQAPHCDRRFGSVE